MALERLDLSGEICVDDCASLLFTDTTGSVDSPCNDEQNDEGYGLTDGIEADDVTTAQLNVYFPSVTTPIIFDFTIASSVITAATLTDLNGTVTNILADLDSTVFPFVDFSITKDYGVTIPTVIDGYYTWDYTIAGVSGGESFSYTTSDSFTSDCTVNCCIEDKYATLDSECGCFDDKRKDLINSEIFLWGSRFAMNVGQDEKAQGFLDKANELCNKNCDC
jgi:hypothetical protein